MYWVPDLVAPLDCCIALDRYEQINLFSWFANVQRIGLWILFQAVGCALNVLGFGESMAGLVGLESTWAQRGFACAAVILLSVINVAGVKWVIKLQFILLLLLLLAGVDFFVGSFTHTNIGELTWVNWNKMTYFKKIIFLYISFVTIKVNKVVILLTLQMLVLRDGYLETWRTTLLLITKMDIAGLPCLVYSFRRSLVF